MAEATQAYHKRDLYSDAARILAESGAAGQVMTLARWHARKAVKRELYEQGIKLANVESREISLAADRYVEEHPEIIAVATESYRTLVATGRLKPPRRRKAVQHLRDLHNERSSDLQGLWLCRYRERNCALPLVAQRKSSA